MRSGQRFSYLALEPEETRALNVKLALSKYRNAIRAVDRALAQLRDLKSFPSADAVNTTTGPQLPKYVSAAFGSLDLPWKPGYLRSAYGAVCCHRFKPQNQTDDIFLAQILDHNSSVRTHPFP